MHISLFKINNNSPCTKNSYYSSSTNFGRRNQSDENNSFSSPSKDSYFEKLIEEIKQARQNGETRQKTIERLHISEDYYKKCVREGNLPRKKQEYITPEKKEEIKKFSQKKVPILYQILSGWKM